MSGTLRAYHKTPEDEDSRLGQVIDSYRLVRRIATGGMGTVYEAVHIHLGRRYAMKVLNPQLQGNAQATARFIAEGQAANQPKGQGIVAVHDVGRAENGSIYILMEYLEGETLSDRIDGAFGNRDARASEDSSFSRPDPPTREYLLRALRLAKQLAYTLEAIHRSGVIHRDLKPDNVFVIQDPEAIGGERVKILDFGIAKVVAPAGRQQNSPVTWAPTLQRTLLGTVLGTPTYMAPEQWRGDGPADERTDSYGLGAILFEMFAGRPPFTAKLIGDLMALHCTEPPPPLDQVAPWVPYGLPDLVHQLLAKDLCARPTMHVVSQRISELLDRFVNGTQPRFGRFGLARIRRAAAQVASTMRSRIGRARASGAGGPIGAEFAANGLAVRRVRARMAAVIALVCACLVGLIVLIVLGPRTPPPPPPDGSSASTTDALLINSKPAGANLYLVDSSQDADSMDALLRPFCRTPCSLPLRTNSAGDFIILASPDYRSRRIPLSELLKARPGTLWQLEPWRRGVNKGKPNPGNALNKRPVRLESGGRPVPDSKAGARQRSKAHAFINQTYRAQQNFSMGLPGGRQ